MSKKRPKIEDIKSEKAIIIEFEDKETKRKSLGLVREFEGSQGKIVMTLEPLVYKADFEGSVRLDIHANVRKFAEIVKKFEASEHEVLLLLGNKGYVYSKRKFNSILESMLEKMVTQKYWKALHKKLQEGYVV